MRTKYFITAIIFISQLIAINTYGQHTSVQVESKKGFNHITDSILTVSVKLLEDVINSDAFKTKILAAPFKRNKKMTNQQIYDMYKQAGENGSQPDFVINLKLEIYYDYAGGSEVGNTTEDDVMHTYQEYITNNGAACYAAHVAHEYCHVLGFTHPKYHLFGNIKKDSVPYQVGDIVAELLKTNCP